MNISKNSFGRHAHAHAWEKSGSKSWNRNHSWWRQKAARDLIREKASRMPWESQPSCVCVFFLGFWGKACPFLGASDFAEEESIPRWPHACLPAWLTMGPGELWDRPVTWHYWGVAGDTGNIQPWEASLSLLSRPSKPLGPAVCVQISNSNSLKACVFQIGPVALPVVVSWCLLAPEGSVPYHLWTNKITECKWVQFLWNSSV